MRRATHKGREPTRRDPRRDVRGLGHSSIGVVSSGLLHDVLRAATTAVWDLALASGDGLRLS